jgi:hypothetical protein
MGTNNHFNECAFLISNCFMKFAIQAGTRPSLQHLRTLSGGKKINFKSGQVFISFSFIVRGWNI